MTARVLTEADLAGIRHCRDRGVSVQACAAIYAIPLMRVRAIWAGQEQIPEPAKADDSGETGSAAEADAGPQPTAGDGAAAAADLPSPAGRAADEVVSAERSPAPVSDDAVPTQSARRRGTCRVCGEPVLKADGSVDGRRSWHTGCAAEAGASGRRARRREIAKDAARQGRTQAAPTERLFGILEAAANAGAPCPTNAVLAGALGYRSESRPPELVRALAAAGRIRVTRVGRWRVVEIAATGARTAKSGRRPNAARDAEILRLRAAGESYRQIAARTGTTLPAVAAVMDRARAEGAAPPLRRAEEMPAEAAPPEASPAVPRLPVPPPRMVALSPARECLYPIGDPGTPGFRFCGAPVWAARPGTSYCAEHHAICWRPAPQRRRVAVDEAAAARGRTIEARAAAAFTRYG